MAELNHYYEGCRLQAYPDPRTGAEPITIGWGSTFYQDGSPIRLGDVITQAQADALYEHNCREKFWKVLVATIPFWAEMGDRQRAGLCSFAYNNGAHFHGDGYHDTLDRHLQERRWGAVPRYTAIPVKRWKWGWAAAAAPRASCGAVGSPPSPAPRQSGRSARPAIAKPGSSG